MSFIARWVVTTIACAVAPDKRTTPGLWITGVTDDGSSSFCG